MALMAASVLKIRERSFLGCLWRPCAEFCDLFFAALISNSGLDGFFGLVRTFVERVVEVKNEDEDQNRLAESRRWVFIGLKLGEDLEVLLGVWRRKTSSTD